MADQKLPNLDLYCSTGIKPVGHKRANYKSKYLKNGFYFSDVYRSVNYMYIGSRAK